MSQQKKVGRPPAGKTDTGEAVPLRSYPRVSIYLKPTLKASLEALSLISGEPVWRILERAAETHLSGLPDADRKFLASVAQRVKEKKKGQS